MPPGQFLSTLYIELAGANTATGHADTAITFLKKALEMNPANNILRFKIAYQYDYHLRKPYEGLPWYREFLKNAPPQTSTNPNPEQLVFNVDLEQLISYSDYAKNRIREIAGHKSK